MNKSIQIKYWIYWFYKIKRRWSRCQEGNINKNLKNTLYKHLAFSHNYGVLYEESCSYIVLLVKETNDHIFMLTRNLSCYMNYSIHINTNYEKSG